MNPVSIKNSITSDLTPSNGKTKQCGYESCQKHVSKMKKCSQCHKQVYCGPTCQQKDWPRHKEVCQVKPSIDCKENKSKPIRVEKAVSGVFPKESKTLVPGFTVYKNFITDDLHKSFIEQLDKGTPERSIGHYDGYSFADQDSFNEVYFGFLEAVSDRIIEKGAFSSEKKPLTLSGSIIGFDKMDHVPRHVDSLLDKGDAIAIISFNKPISITFYSEVKDKREKHTYSIPPKSLLMISGDARFKWSHSITRRESAEEDLSALNRGYLFMLYPTRINTKHAICVIGKN